MLASKRTDHIQKFQGQPLTRSIKQEVIRPDLIATLRP